MLLASGYAGCQPIRKHAWKILLINMDCNVGNSWLCRTNVYYNTHEIDLYISYKKLIENMASIPMTSRARKHFRQTKLETGRQAKGNINYIIQMSMFVENIRFAISYNESAIWIVRSFDRHVDYHLHWNLSIVLHSCFHCWNWVRPYGFHIKLIYHM